MTNDELHDAPNDEKPKHCLCCLGQLEQDPSIDRALQATWWIAYGNFGSTVYDPSPLREPAERLEAWICDNCLTQRARYIERVRFAKRIEIISREEYDPRVH